MKVALAISSYNGDMAVVDLARHATSAELAGMFVGVAVIDSGDADRRQTLVSALDEIEGVDYRGHEGNLGAAANLELRIWWADSVGADALLAVNSDGSIGADNVRVMAELMDKQQAAAVYPTAILEGDRVDLSYRRPVPVLPSRRSLKSFDGPSSIEVAWGSSNGALYRLDAVRSVPFSQVTDLWHGWEDLALGLTLRARGWSQFMSLDARQPTASDQRRISRTGPVVSAKAPWTTYYTTRNLILLGRNHPTLRHRVIARIAREFAMILLRDRRIERYRRAAQGVRDGLHGRTGQGVRPEA